MTEGTREEEEEEEEEEVEEEEVEEDATQSLSVRTVFLKVLELMGVFSSSLDTSIVIIITINLSLCHSRCVCCSSNNFQLVTE